MVLVDAILERGLEKTIGILVLNVFINSNLFKSKTSGKNLIKFRQHD